MKNIWNELPSPFFILAPMDDVTDTVFRRVIIATCRPDLFFTEFANVDGLISKKGSKIVGRKLKYTDTEHPIIAQLWGNNPDHYFKAGKIVQKLGFDGIDINFGCPIQDVVKKGCGGGAIGNIQLAREIVEATLAGSNNMPISVKTRLGIKTIKTEEWIGELLTLPLSAIIIHGRTVSEMSKVPAHWDEIKKAVEIKNKLKKKILIIGNGDVKNREEGLQKVRQVGVDGIMIGRGIFHDIYAFSRDQHTHTIDINKRLEILNYHIKLYEKTWGDTRPYDNLKKYFKMYINGFDKAVEIRNQLMTTTSYNNYFEIIPSVLKYLASASI